MLLPDAHQSDTLRVVLSNAEEGPQCKPHDDGGRCSAGATP